jgi:hypothetical protein
MKLIRRIHLETERVMFELEIYEKADSKGYVGEYYGTSPKFAQVVRPGAPITIMHDEGSRKLENSDIEKLVSSCRTEIELKYGPIVRSDEHGI